MARKRTAVGLDIGCSGVRAAELSFNRQGVTLERFGQIALPEGAVQDGEVHDEAAVVNALKELWSVTKMGSKKVVLGVANQRVIVKTIELPNLPSDELKKTLPFQVADLIPIPVEEALLDFHPLEVIETDTGNVVRGMLVAALKETVERNISCVQNAGLEPTMVDLTSFAVLRSVGRQFDPMVDTEAVIDVGARVTNMIVHSGGYPRFVRILLLGGEDITDTVSERIGVHRDQAEHLKQTIGLNPSPTDEPAAARAIEEAALRFVDEVRGSLDYYNASNPDYPIDKVSVSGGASCLNGLLQQLAAATRLTVVPADPMSTLTVGNTGLDEHQLELVKPLAAVPVGLALGLV